MACACDWLSVPCACDWLPVPITGQIQIQIQIQTQTQIQILSPSSKMRLPPVSRSAIGDLEAGVVKSWNPPFCCSPHEMQHDLECGLAVPSVWTGMGDG